MIHIEKVIVGGGTVAQIAKLFHPNALVIAPEGNSYLALQEIWDNTQSRILVNRFGLEYSVKNKIVRSASIGESVKKYNELTRKNLNSKPCEGIKEFFALDVQLPPIRFSVCDTVDKIDFDNMTLMTKQDELFVFDEIFIASPLTFDMEYTDKNFNESALVKPEYFPASFVECEVSKFRNDWDFLYLFEDEFLNNSLYRVVRKSDKKYVFEFACDKEFVLKQFSKCARLYELLGDLKVTDIKENRFAHFYNKDMSYWTQIKDAHFISRYSRLDNDFMIHDSIKELLTAEKVNLGELFG